MAPDVRDESFLPWAQIEPLLTPGMTARDLANRLRELTGLPGSYCFELTAEMADLPLIEAIRGGLRAVKASKTGTGRNSAEPVR